MTIVSNGDYKKKQVNLDTYTQASNVKYISIILTQFNDRFSSFIRMFAKQEYTHVSLGLEGYERAFTFNYRGFSLEKPERLLLCRKNISIVLEISNEQYEAMKSVVQDYEKRKYFLKYTYLGVILSALRMPFVLRNTCFCSQFVAETLKAGGIHLQKKSHLYLPQNLYLELLDTARIHKIISY